MNVFVIGSPLQTALVLDARRLNKQIIECKQILKAIKGETKAWANHPATLQYRNHVVWLKLYTQCLESFKNNESPERIYAFSLEAQKYTPEWHTSEYLTQMKRRLYTKNKEHYSQWSHLGESDVNMYYVDGEWRYYKNGKKYANILDN